LVETPSSGRKPAKVFETIITSQKIGFIVFHAKPSSISFLQRMRRIDMRLRIYSPHLTVLQPLIPLYAESADGVESMNDNKTQLFENKHIRMLRDEEKQD